MVGIDSGVGNKTWGVPQVVPPLRKIFEGPEATSKPLGPAHIMEVNGTHYANLGGAYHFVEKYETGPRTGSYFSRGLIPAEDVERLGLSKRRPQAAREL